MRLCVETGVAGLSIEDSTSDPAIPLYDFDLALARVRAARAAIDRAGGDVVFTARSEGFIRGRPDLDETIRRLRHSPPPAPIASIRPGIRTPRADRGGGEGGGAQAGQPAGIDAAASPWRISPRMGVRRISVGGTLARVAWHAAIRSATRDRRSTASSTASPDSSPHAELNAFFRDDCQEPRAMTALWEPHPITGQPVGLPVDETPAQPARRR